MDWLNYHHLYYFWTIAQEGSLSKAAVRLRLTHSTLSAQLRELEDFLGDRLFERKGRRLLLTDFGAEIADYASDIFHMGSELIDVARGRAAARRSTFRVGVLGTLPKTIVYRLLEPVLLSEPRAVVQIRQDNIESLLHLLATSRVHLVLSDAPPPAELSYRVHSHTLGDTEILLYGTPNLAAKYRRDFPASLSGAPILMPSSGSSLRRDLERWFADRDLRVQMIFEVNDAGLMRVFGAFGHGLFPVRTVLSAEVEETHKVAPVGPLNGVQERYYAISLERRIRSPYIAAIINAARARLLSPQRVPASRDARA